MKQILYGLSCLLVIACSSVEEKSLITEENDFIQIDLKKNYDNKGKGFLIYYPLNLLEDSTRNQIVFPDLSEVKDTAYAHAYFTGENEGALNRLVLMLVGDYNSSSPKIWVDDNNDLKFTENEQFYSFEKDSLDFFLPNSKKSDLHFEYCIYKLPDSVYTKINKDITECFTQGKHLGFYFEHRRNIKMADFAYQGDSIRIGLFDSNCDGRFNTIGKDKIVFGDFGKSITRTAEYQGALTLDSMSYFNSKHYGFQILEIAADGSAMKIKPLESKKLLTRLGVGDTLPDFVLENVDEGSRSVYAGLKGQKYIYLNFWATWCGGCKQEMPDLIALNKDYTDEVYMLSINYEQDVETVKSFMDKYDMEWTNALSTPEIIEAFKVEGMPRNVLLDGSGKILDMNIRPDKLMDLIEKAKVTPKQGV